jgi:hypothetical protein
VSRSCDLDGRDDSFTTGMVAALAACGFTDHDRRHLRFFFETAGLRAAVELALELRSLTPDSVHVRPSPLRLLTRRRWTVAFTTPPAPLTLGVIQLWESQMHAMADRRPGSRCVRWKPLLNLEDGDRITARSDSWNQ